MLLKVLANNICFNLLNDILGRFPICHFNAAIYGCSCSTNSGWYQWLCFWPL